MNTKKKKNIWIEHSTHYEGICTKGNSFYISKEDYDLCNQYTWLTEKKGYLVTRKDGKNIRLHRLIMNFPDLTVDHINRNKLDNRRCNLRECTIQENNRNKGVYKRETELIRLSEKYNMNINTLRSRKYRGLPLDNKLKKSGRKCRMYNYNGETNNIEYFAKKYDININTLKARIQKGFSIEEAIEKKVFKRTR